MEYEFLDLDDVLELHAEQIELHGGDPSIRDMGLLESALAQPSARFGGNFLHKDIFEMGAAYLFHIVKNHPFVDGNKRTGTAAALIFLGMNGVRLTIPIDAFERYVLSVASSMMTKHELAELMRQHAEAI